MLRMTINNVNYVYFSDLAISLNYTGFVSQFSFNAPFDHQDEGIKNLFRPLTYPTVKIFYNNDLLLTGNIIKYTFTDEGKPGNAAFSGYSKCGILQDVSIPQSLYPLQSTNRTLKEIVNRLIQPFGIKASYIIAPESDSPYEETVAEPESSIGSYIHKLCEQRNLMLSHDSEGNLVISKPKHPGIFTNFTDNYRAVNSVLTIDGQSLYSDYTAIRQSSVENEVQPQATHKFPIPFRSITKIQQDGEQGDIEGLAKAMVSNSGRAITLNLKLDRWTNYQNLVYRPGYVVGYQNSEVGMDTLVNMFIESVSLAQKNKTEVATLSLIPAWVIFDTQPQNPFI